MYKRTSIINSKCVCFSSEKPILKVSFSLNLFHGFHITAKLIDFECHMMAPEIRLVLTVGFDPKGYFPGGFNLFKLANEKLFGFFYLYYIDHLLVYGKNLYVPQLLLCNIDIE